MARTSVRQFGEGMAQGGKTLLDGGCERDVFNCCGVKDLVRAAWLPSFTIRESKVKQGVRRPHGGGCDQSGEAIKEHGGNKFQTWAVR